MSMMMRRGMMVPAVVPGGLPGDYLRVQYIQGTGTQYIITNLTGNIDREWIFDISDFDKNGNSYAPLFGIAVVGSNLGVYLANIKIYTAFGNKGDITYNTTVSGWTNRFTLRQSKDGVYENDTHVLNAYSSLTYGSSDIPMAFPGRNGANGVERITGAKIYGFVCKENGVVIADYVPCIRISDSKPGMYDLVGRQFYVNQGTGEFVVGWYVDDGLIFHMDGADRGGVSGQWTDKVNGYTFEIPEAVTETQLGVVFPSNSTQHIRYDGDVFPTIVDDAYKTITTEYCYSEVSAGYGQNIFILQSVGTEKPCAHVSDSVCVYANTSHNNRGVGVIRGMNSIISLNNDRGFFNGIPLEVTLYSPSASYNNRYTTIGSNQGLSYRFKGTIHSIRVYNRKLTEAEMLQNQRVDNFRYQLGLTI